MRKTSASRRPRSYVVRIYRQSANHLAGQVEDIQSGLIVPFRSSAELWLAIGGERAGAARKVHVAS